MHGSFAEIALLLLVSAAVGALFVRLRQPVLIACVVVGIAVGPAGFGWVQAHDQIEVLAQIGVAVLLCVVGLKLALYPVRTIAPVALATGLGQLAFTIALGFLIVLGLGRNGVEAGCVAVALTFSSTVVIAKLLSDKGDLDTLHDHVGLGLLILQGLAVVVVLVALSPLRGSGDGTDPVVLDVPLSLTGRLLVAAALLYALVRWVLPSLVASMALSQALLFVFAVALGWRWLRWRSGRGSARRPAPSWPGSRWRRSASSPSSSSPWASRQLTWA